jgi:hypothetical protein
VHQPASPSRLLRQPQHLAKHSSACQPPRRGWRCCHRCGRAAGLMTSTTLATASKGHDQGRHRLRGYARLLLALCCSNELHLPSRPWHSSCLS